MGTLALLLMALFLPQESFVDFSFCRHGLRAGEPIHCIQLDAAGAGAFAIKPADDTRDGDEGAGDPVALSEAGLREFQRLLADTDYLSEASTYASDRVTANLGQKTLVIEGDWGTREASFNYTERSEVNRLVTFLDGLVAQQVMLRDLEFALRFDRLGLPTVLEGLAEDLGDDRFPDPVVFIDTLGRIVDDGRVVNYARTTAGRLIEDIEDD